MERIKFEKEQVRAIYDEVDRRLRNDARDVNEYELIQERRAMLQGVYSVFCAVASNWPDVCEWTDELEETYF